MLKVLEFWHKVEFFNVFNYQSEIDDGNIIASFNKKNLRNSILPWHQNAEPELFGLDSMKSYRFYIYFLMFEKHILYDYSKHYLSSESTDLLRAVEFEERFSDEGLTCYARIAIDSELSIDSLEVSTLPWALSKLADGKLNQISYEGFEKDVELLKNNFSSINFKSQDTNKIFDADSIFVAVKYLLEWAKIDIDDNLDIIGIKAIEQRDKKKEEKSEIQTECKNTEEEMGDGEPEIKSVENEDTDSLIGKDVGILNSFFIKDIELSINQLNNNIDAKVLKQYLSCDRSEKTDLRSEKGVKDIFEILSPEHMNLGRWPSNDNIFMGLMQQYAINRIQKDLKDGGLYSVNGPPGTGKTTMFRDLIANNIVNRANVLAEFDCAKDTFTRKVNVPYSSESKCQFIRTIDQRLCGFEILVVSSNNAAVENISKELPLLSSLGSEYQDVSYLKKIAQKYIANHTKKGELEELSSENEPWGLIACSLGKKRNRTTFLNKLFMQKTGGMKTTEKSKTYECIWDLYSIAKGSELLLFEEAKEEFLNAKKELSEYLDKVKQIHIYHKNYATLGEETFCLSEIKAVDEKKRMIFDDSKEISDIVAQYGDVETSLAEIDTQQRLLEESYPGFFASLLSSKKRHFKKKLSLEIDTFEEEKEALIIKRSRLAQEKAKYETRLNTANKELARLKVRLESKQAEYRTKIKEYTELLNELGDLSIPKYDEDLEKAEIQRKAFWQNEHLNNLRTQLTIKALELHEAWLIDSMKTVGGFHYILIEISNLLKNGRYVYEPELTLALWQMLFMIVPVVSSTFASVERQFKGMNADSLGWVFIDEAGQALPQSAVGTMLRAKRCVVVGDPLQIEPVFTTSPELVEELANQTLGEGYNNKWLPTISSVQRIADSTNRYGMELVSDNGIGQWLGSPLRVHRRCKNPMFEIANRIAYDNTMFHGEDTPIIAPHSYFGESSWLDIEGRAGPKQYVPKQAEIIRDKILLFYEENGNFPPIYIISPFKKVKEEILRYLKEELKHNFNDTKLLNGRIGTVHTFQGKEEEIVFLVLGADEETEGAANWASSKPNLLNVALTRAKKYIYIVGSKRVWANKRYFDQIRL